MLIPQSARVKSTRIILFNKTVWFYRPAAQVKACLCAGVLLLVLTPAANGWVRHRPAEGSTIAYAKEKWTVKQSKEDNPKITIMSQGSKNKTQTIPWADSDFWNETPGDPNNVQHNLDLRDPRRWHAKDSDYTAKDVCADFNLAMGKALEAVKAIIMSGYKSGQQQSIKRTVEAIALTDFAGSKADNNPQHKCDSNPNNYSEWNLKQEILKIEWAITIDADRPPAESPQEPHVGFTVSHDKERVIGHVWLNAVPVTREALHAGESNGGERKK